MALKITDLPVDVLSYILASVGKSSNGAKDIAKSISVCKRFLEAGKSNIVYEVVCFKRIEVLIRHYLFHFQRTDGLLYNCASAGNLVAQFFLAQVILMSSTQLKSFNIKNTRLKHFRNYTPRYNVGTRKCQEGYIVASFMANFTPGRSFHPFLPHWELIKLFLCNCTTMDTILLCRHIRAYVEYFRGQRTRRGTDANAFLSSVRSMCNVDEHKFFMSLFSQLGFNYSLLSPSVLKWVFKRESYTKTADNLVEGVRLKAVHDFDRVSRAFPGFAVPRWKK